METYNVGLMVSGALVVLLVGIFGVSTGNMPAAYLALAAACLAWLANVSMAGGWLDEITLSLSSITVLATVAGIIALLVG